MVDEEKGSTEVFIPRKSNLSRLATKRGSLRKSMLSASLPGEGVSSRQHEGGPMYSKDYLDELKSLTPSTPQQYSTAIKELDVSSKFGTDLTRYKKRAENSVIPTEVEITEKKARRRRLAKEHKYHHRGSDDSEGSEDEEKETEDLSDQSSVDEFHTQADRIALSHRPGTKSPETRLVRDDEDYLEDFDSFVSDGRITLTRNAEKEQHERRKEEMRGLIEDAEGGSTDEDSDDSERERREEYEAAQTRKAMGGLKGDKNGLEDDTAKMPAKVTPLPSFAGVLERLRLQSISQETGRLANVQRIEEIAAEKQELEARGKEIQRLLAEAGDRYEKLRLGLNIPLRASPWSERGLENLVATPMRVAEGPENQSV